MNSDNKNIFYTRNTEPDKEIVKENYYKSIERKQRFICLENKAQQEYIQYLQHILEQNNIKYFKGNLL